LSRSPDGNGFTNFQANGYLGSRYVTCANGLFVSQDLQTSADGTNWTSTAFTPTNSGVFLQDIGTGNGVIIAVGNVLAASTNGLSFSILNSALPASVLRLKFAQGLFHAVGSGGSLIRSTNGLDWVSRTSATGADLSDIEYGNGQWVAVGSGGTITVSPAGNAWALRTSGTALALNGIAYGTNLFVVVGQAGTVLTSSDGNTWTPQFAGTTKTLNKVTFGNGQFLAIGQSGTVLTSPDGVNWTSRTAGTSNDLASVSFGDGVFCIGQASPLLTSPDTVVWTPRRTGSSASAVRFLNGTFFVIGDGNILQSGPVAPVQLGAAWGTGLPRITVQASPGLLLRLQSVDDFTGAAWQDRGLITNSPAGTSVFEDPAAASLQQRFYRAVAP
jgi:hypothetical protein